MEEQLKEMMEKLIKREYDCNEFSYDFPDAMLNLDDDKLLNDLDDMPEICASYDPFKTDEKELLNDDELISKVEEIYNKVFC